MRERNDTGTPSPRPLAIAHRAGNHPRALLEAQEAGVDLIELDVWLHRGRLEVRHLKTLGRVPLLWDRWRLVGAWTPRLYFEDLLRQANPAVELMLDLKGKEPGLGPALQQAMADWRADAPYSVSSQRWELLDPFLPLGHVRVVHSVGFEEQLARLRARIEAHPNSGIGIHNDLLSPERVEELRGMSDTLLTWTINTVERYRQLAEWGVTGIISDELDVLRTLLRESS